MTLPRKLISLFAMDSNRFVVILNEIPHVLRLESHILLGLILPQLIFLALDGVIAKREINC
jgi:hypothetical protein